MFKNFIGHKTKIINLLIICPLTTILLSSCSSETQTRQGIYFYLVTAPINKKQVKITESFLSMIENPENTRVVTQGNKYTIAELCRSNNPYMVLPGLRVSDSSEKQRTAVLSMSKSSLSKIRGESEPKKGESEPKVCSSKPESLVNVITKLSNATKEKDVNLILLAQAPWSQEELTPEVLTKLTNANAQLSSKQKLRKIILFGVNPDSASKISQTFEVFNNNGQKVFESVATDIPQMSLKLQQIRSEFLVKAAP
jgi:hypothetical protein